MYYILWEILGKVNLPGCLVNSKIYCTTVIWWVTIIRICMKTVDFFVLKFPSMLHFYIIIWTGSLFDILWCSQYKDACFISLPNILCEKVKPSPWFHMVDMNSSYKLSHQMKTESFVQTIKWMGYKESMIVCVCDWIWEKPASTHTTVRHTFTIKRWLYTLTNYSARYWWCRLILLWLVSEAFQTSTSVWVFFKWLHIPSTSRQPAVI